jgi:hypothetical protein
MAPELLVSSKCQRTDPLSCSCTNVKAHYQHPGTTHQWEVQPAQGPTPDSAPHPTPCPNDTIMTGPWPVVYSKCPLCGFIKYW